MIHSGDNFTLDLPSGQIGATLQAFEDQCGPLTADRCTAVAVAARDDDVHVVISAALWLFLFRPSVECEMNAQRLAEIIRDDGSVLLTAMFCDRSGAWTFRLFAMPRWPAVVAPYRATSRDIRRRWR